VTRRRERSFRPLRDGGPGVLIESHCAFEARRGRRILVGVLLHVNPTRNGAALFTAARKLLNRGFQRI